MKQNWVKISALVLAVALLPAAIMAQDEKKDKEEKEKVEKVEKKEKKVIETYTITRKNDSKEKVVIEINGDKVTVNGKPLDEFKDDDVSIRRNKRDVVTWTPGTNMGNTYDWNTGNGNFNFQNEDENRAMLGVVTEKCEKGVEIQDITKESGASKAGLKEGDVITRIGDKKIEDPDQLSEVIQKHKPGEKISVTYLRDGKEEKTTAELSKWKGVNAFSMPKMDMGNMDFGQIMPKIQTVPRTPGSNNSLWGVRSGQPKLGLSVQDTDDGKGVKVIEVDDESTALKAGVKKDDLILEVDGKAVNSTDEVSKIIKESKEKNSIMLKLNRSGKTQNIEVKMPKKIKTTDI